MVESGRRYWESVSALSRRRLSQWMIALLGWCCLVGKSVQGSSIFSD